MIIEEKIKRIRKLRGMTQNELGLASGFTRDRFKVRVNLQDGVMGCPPLFDPKRKLVYAKF